MGKHDEAGKGEEGNEEAEGVGCSSASKADTHAVRRPS